MAAERLDDASGEEWNDFSAHPSRYKREAPKLNRLQMYMLRYDRELPQALVGVALASVLSCAVVAGCEATESWVHEANALQLDLDERLSDFYDLRGLRSPQTLSDNG